MSRTPPLVSVGIPTYDRPESLRQVLDCIRGQTYTHLEIIVSDNGSPGSATDDVVHEVMLQDTRVSFLKQETNRGPAENFRRGLEAARGEYFMWAADDDLWANGFIESGVQFLEERTACDAWFAGIVNIDTFGAKVREYPRFSRFTSTGSRTRDVYRFVCDPEILGKANLIYSLFRREALQREVRLRGFGTCWGSDMCFNLAFLSRHDIHCDDEVLFYKRVIRDDDDARNPKEISIELPNRYIFPLSQSWPYFRGNWSAVSGARLKAVVLFAFLHRTPIALRNRFLQFLRVY